jgi:hypothetical protein
MYLWLASKDPGEILDKDGNDVLLRVFFVVAPRTPSNLESSPQNSARLLNPELISRAYGQVRVAKLV